MASFGWQYVNYYENRADGGFAWDVKYYLKMQGAVVSVSLDIAFNGVDPGAALRAIWETGIETTWNKKVFFDDGVALHPVRLDVDFVAIFQDQTVTVHPGAGRYDMANWYETPQGWGNSYRGIAAAHEIGHMLGNFDEYAGGATYQGYTTTGTLMSDLTLAGFRGYFWTVEFYTELFGYGSANALVTVLARIGNGAANFLSGTSARDGFYGFGGDDLIFAGGGNDYADGGPGNDRLNGGSSRDRLIGGPGRDDLGGGPGNDMLTGNAGGDSFRFNTALNPFANVDAITDFAVGQDLFLLDHRVMSRLGPLSHSLAPGQFHRNAPHDGNDFVIYVASTGAVFYDSNGSGPGQATQFAQLQAGLFMTYASFFVV